MLINSFFIFQVQKFNFFFNLWNLFFLHVSALSFSSENFSVLAAIRFFGNSIDGLAEAIPLGYSSIAGSYCGAEMAAKDLDVPTFFLGLLV